MTIVINVKVKPSSKVESLSYSNGIYHAKLKQEAREGKANLALIKMLSKYFNVSMSDIKIVRGIRSKNKNVIIKNVDEGVRREKKV